MYYILYVMSFYADFVRMSGLVSPLLTHTHTHTQSLMAGLSS
jgi:hypothetical protein